MVLTMGEGVGKMWIMSSGHWWATLWRLSACLPLCSSLRQSDYVTVQTWLLLPCVHCSVIASTLSNLAKTCLKILINPIPSSCFLCFLLLNIFAYSFFMPTASNQGSPEVFPLAQSKAFPLPLVCVWFSAKVHVTVADNLALACSE